MNLISFLKMTNLLGASAESSLDPIYSAISTIGPYAMGVIVLCGLIYGVIFGVKFAKCETAEDKSKTQKALINGIIGFVTVLLLIIILYAIREPLANWMNS